jgi:hypothetical protein
MPLIKKKDGWKAEDTFDFMGARRLCVSTYKIDGKLVSHASVNEYGDQMMRHACGGDFSSRVIVTPGARGTEKSIAAQHAEALLLVPQLLEEAKAHYAKYPPRD